MLWSIVLSVRPSVRRGNVTLIDHSGRASIDRRRRESVGRCPRFNVAGRRRASLSRRRLRQRPTASYTHAPHGGHLSARAGRRSPTHLVFRSSFLPSISDNEDDSNVVGMKETYRRGLRSTKTARRRAVSAASRPGSCVLITRVIGRSIGTAPPAAYVRSMLTITIRAPCIIVDARNEYEVNEWLAY